MHTIAIANQKGGAGKTSTAAALWYWMNANGYKALGIDLDAQGNLSYTVNAAAGGPSIYDALDIKQPTITAADAVQHLAGGDFIPASFALNGADITIQGKGREYRLREALAPLNDSYDFAIIDTEPHLGILTVNALTAADRVILPTQADMFSLQGIAQLWSNIRMIVESGANPSLKVDGILLTRYNARTTIARDLKDLLQATAEKMGTRLYDTTIREATAVKESQARQESIFKTAPGSHVAHDYESFIKEFWGGHYDQ